MSQSPSDHNIRGSLLWAALHRRPTPPHPPDPKYRFDKKTPGKYSSQTQFDSQKRGLLSSGLNEMKSKKKGFWPKSGHKAPGTVKIKNATAAGEVDHSGLESGSRSLKENFGSGRK